MIGLDVMGTLEASVGESGDLPVILIGDFNAHLFYPVNSKGSDLLHLMTSYGLCCLNNSMVPTYIHAGASTIINYAIVSDGLKPNSSFRVGDVMPESLHRPIVLSYKSHLRCSLSSSPFAFAKPPSPTTPSAADVWMRNLIQKADTMATTAQTIDSSRVQDSISMSTVRRRLRPLGKRRMTPDTMAEVSSLRQNWRIFSNRKLKLKRKGLQQEMWNLRGCKAYWSFVNSLRRRKSGIPLAPRHVEQHYKNLLGQRSTVREDFIYERDPLFANLPEVQPRQPGYKSIKDEDGLGDILGGVDELLTSPIMPLEISYALSKMSNSAMGEDAIQVNTLRSIASRDIAQFYINLVDDLVVPTCWNRAILVPIPKKGTPTTALQLRGIAIQPAL